MKHDPQKLHRYIKRLRVALEMLLGASSKTELTALASKVLSCSESYEDKLVALSAIHALLAVMEVYEEPNHDQVD